MLNRLFMVFGSIFMGPSWIGIFMKINIFLFGVLKSQDFLDPDFSDTCMWVQDPHENKWNYGYPHFDGSWTHIHVSEKYGSKKSWRLKSSNRNILIFIKIHIQEGPVTRDPKTPKTHPAAKLCCGWEERAICEMHVTTVTCQDKVVSVQLHCM